MLETRIALLRGINLGRARRVAMADLRAMLEDMGYAGVRTVRNSGNVVLKSKAAGGETPAEMETGIEAGLVEQLGVSSRAIVLTAAELAAVVRENPLLDVADNPSRLQVVFLADPADCTRLQPLLTRDWRPDALALGRRVAYLWCPKGMSQNALYGAVSDLLGDRVTTRTWSTVLKLHALVEISVTPAA
jgi:uncharacterized protein (DUF1697 family)